jgi:hypothetical protein
MNPTFFLTTPKAIDADTSVLHKAASFLSASARWLVHARAGGLKSDGLDMSRLGRVMGTANIPGESVDTLAFHGATSKHVVVQAGGGHFFRVDILTPDGSAALPTDNILVALEEIRRLSRNKSGTDLHDISNDSESGVGVGVLTSMPRTDWFHARQHLLSISPDNHESLAQIDSALLMVALDETKTDDLTERCRSGLHGIDQSTRSDRWWDKMQLLVDGHGRLGLHFEHSPSDGICWNRWLGEVWHAMGEMETPAKWVYGHVPEATGESASPANVMKIDFELDDALRTDIVRADKLLEEGLADAVDTLATTFEEFGKTEIKALVLTRCICANVLPVGVRTDARWTVCCYL